MRSQVGAFGTGQNNLHLNQSSVASAALTSFSFAGTTESNSRLNKILFSFIVF